MQNQELKPSLQRTITWAKDSKEIDTPTSAIFTKIFANMFSEVNDSDDPFTKHLQDATLAKEMTEAWISVDENPYLQGLLLSNKDATLALLFTSIFMTLRFNKVTSANQLVPTLLTGSIKETNENN